jgi:glutamine synthetase
MYTHGHTVDGVKKLPLNLLDALRNLEGASVFSDAFGKDVVGAYVTLKKAEWDEYCRHLTDWERQQTLDC